MLILIAILYRILVSWLDLLLWDDLECKQGVYQPPGVLLVQLVHLLGLDQRPQPEIQSDLFMLILITIRVLYRILILCPDLVLWHDPERGQGL